MHTVTFCTTKVHTVQRCFTQNNPYPNHNPKYILYTVVLPRNAQIDTVQQCITQVHLVQRCIILVKHVQRCSTNVHTVQRCISKLHTV